MHTSFARTSQMLTHILGFCHAQHMHTHASTKDTHSHTRMCERVSFVQVQRIRTRAHTCTRVFKSSATERLESPLREQNKSCASELPNLHYAGFSKNYKSPLRGFLSPALTRILKARFANQ